MNRKQRRKAERLAPATTPAGGSGAAARFFTQAVQHFQAGRLSEATDLYRQALAADPRHSGSLHHLGVLAFNIGRADAAVDMIGRAIAIDDANPAFHYDIGMAFLALDRHADAVRHGQRAAALKPGLGSAHMLIADAFLKQGQLDQAIASYREGLARDPGRAAAHDNLAKALNAQNRRAEAIRHFEEALRLDPSLIGSYPTLADLCVLDGDIARAFDVTLRWLSVEQTPRGKALFMYCLPRLPSVSVGGQLRRLMVQAISEPWGRPVTMVRSCLAVIKADPGVSALISRAATVWPQRLSYEDIFEADAFSDIGGDALLEALLQNTPVHDVAMERFLTQARGALLARVSSGGTAIPAGTLGFACALAHQCFINEYVYDESPGERTQVALLRARVCAQLQSGAPVDAVSVAVLAAYEPLSALDGGEALLSQSWSPALDGLLTQQIREPMAERALRDRIPNLTPIEDEVSVLVREQYEENPYPRWVKCAPPENRQTVNGHLQRTFPHARFRPLGLTEEISVLVAGCGTGQQVVEAAQRYSETHVLAVDLSLTSLCYAKYRTDALGLDNVDYGQADILKLGTIGRSFDVIECGGVLHHLRDPLEGWRVLVSLLRGGGIMRLAFYSELARADIVAARDFIAERGYGSSVEDIRRCRQDIFALDEESPVKSVARRADFFSTSNCRDLLLHVQEHRFTLPQIRDFLVAHKLEMLGFDMDLGLLQHYSARFPGDPARTNLDNWHLFEQDNPRTFMRMYQFYVQKQD